VTEILNAKLSQQLKDEILDYMEDKHNTWVHMARSLAIELANQNGDVVADDVREILYAQKCFPKHPNAWGAVFRGAQLRFTGEWRPSAVPKRHRAYNRVWELA